MRGCSCSYRGAAAPVALSLSFSPLFFIATTWCSPFLCACRNDPQTLLYHALSASESSFVEKRERERANAIWSVQDPAPLEEQRQQQQSIRWDFYIKVVGYSAVAPSEQTSFQEATDRCRSSAGVASMTAVRRGFAKREVKWSCFTPNNSLCISLLISYHITTKRRRRRAAFLRRQL